MKWVNKAIIILLATNMAACSNNIENNVAPKVELRKNEKGQYAILNLKHPKVTELDLPYRWLPLVSNGEEEQLRFQIKKDSSSFSKSCEQIAIGDEAIVFGPIG